MGIELTLQGADALNLARSAAALIPGWLVFGGRFGLDDGFDGFPEVGEPI
jgi:hypothetical protein